MEIDKLKTIEDLKQFAEQHFIALPPDKYKKDVFTASFSVTGYKDLLFVITDLIKLCNKAIDAEESHDPNLIVSPVVGISNILDIAIQLLPIDGAELLDQMRVIMKSTDK